MKWISSVDKIYNNKTDFKLKPVIRKCTGFISHWKIYCHIHWTGKSWFVCIKMYNCNKNGSDFIYDRKIGIVIKKHHGNKNIRTVKRWAEYMINNPVDYVENVDHLKELKRS